jgi:hypothetical protein
LVVEFGFVDEHVRVRVRRDGEVALADVLTDPRPGDPAEVQERDAVAEVVRAERRDAGGDACSRDRSAEPIAAGA